MNDRHHLTPEKSNYPDSEASIKGRALEQIGHHVENRPGLHTKTAASTSSHHLAEPELRQSPSRPHPDQSGAFMHTCYPGLHFFLHLKPKLTSVLLKLKSYWTPLFASLSNLITVNESFCVCHSHLYLVFCFYFFVFSRQGISV